LIFPLALERAATMVDGPSPQAISQNPTPLTAGHCAIQLEPGEARWLNVVVPA
jgi:hypothetical protein